MLERPIEQLTLREMLTEAERHSRELSDHLEKGFLPKLVTLQKLVESHSTESEIQRVKDVTIYTAADKLLQSEQFTEQQYQRFEELLVGICSAVEKISVEQ